MAEDGEGEENLGQVGDQVVVQQDHLVWCEDDKNCSVYDPFAHAPSRSWAAEM